MRLDGTAAVFEVSTSSMLGAGFFQVLRQPHSTTLGKSLATPRMAFLCSRSSQCDVNAA
jgi:hypothetical protein